MAVALRSSSTSATLYLAVSTTGSDSAASGRPSAVFGGDYTSKPYLTLAAALAALPRVLLHQVFVTVGAGTFDGATVSGFSGGGFDGTNDIGLRTVGTFANVTPTTGVATGTAGSGTTSTSMVKPTLAANWTASDLVGKLLYVTGGGGAGSTYFPIVRQILANTATTLTVDAITGLDSTSVFSIVTPSTLLREITDESTCLRVCFNSAPVFVAGLDFAPVAQAEYLARSYSNASVTLEGCYFDQPTDIASVSSTNDSEFYVKNYKLSNLADIKVERCSKYASVTNGYATGQGEVYFKDVLTGHAYIRSASSSSTVFRAEKMLTLTAEVVANTGGGGATTPTIYLEGISNFEATGTNKLTGTGNAGYGLQIEGHGRYNLTGSTITGTGGDVLFFDNLVTWTNLGGLTYGIATEHAGSAFANSTYGKALHYGSHLHYGSQDFSARCLHYGHINESANLAVVNLTDTTPYDMGDNDLCGTIHVNSTNAGAIVVLNDACAIAGVKITIANTGTQQVTAQAPAGASITGSAVVAAGSAATFVSLVTNSGKDFLRIS